MRCGNTATKYQEETRAAIYERIGLFYYFTGEQKKGARFFLRAIACNPLEERTFRYLRLGFKRMLRAVNPRVWIRPRVRKHKLEVRYVVRLSFIRNLARPGR